MCGAQACLCIQGVILGRDSGGLSSSCGLRSLCAYILRRRSSSLVILTIFTNLSGNQVENRRTPDALTL